MKFVDFQNNPILLVATNGKVTAYKPDHTLYSGPINLECDTLPHYAFLDQDYWPDPQNPQTPRDESSLNLNDKFPVPACPNEKAALFMQDATLWCWYHATDGWVIFKAVRGGFIV